MQETSALYREIYGSENYYVETALAIGESGRLLTEKGEVLLFGGDAILIGQTGADSGYGEDMLLSIRTQKKTFKSNTPEAGCCVCGEIDIEMYMPIGDIERRAMLTPFIRLVSKRTGKASEWLKKGIFYIDTRTNTKNRDELDILRLHGYDAMLMTEQSYPESKIQWPALDISVVNEIADTIGVHVDPRCIPYLNRQYMIPYPANYSMREVLGQIGGAYGGNWIMNDNGELQFIPLWGLPVETSILIDHLGNRIVFGEGDYGTRILL